MSWSENEKREVAKALMATSTAAGKPIDEFGLDCYIGAIKGSNVGSVLEELRECYLDRRFPSPNQLREKLTGAVGEKALASRAADLIVEALEKDGAPNRDRARERMGELAWAVVESQGGWDAIGRQAVSYEAIRTLKAQWRDSAMALQEMARKGHQGPPAIPAGRSPAPGLNAVSAVLESTLSGILPRRASGGSNG
jgi:hypothetical protein